MSGGPRYVKDFEFPSSFGFTGSATDSMRTMVKSYERAKPRFAEGGPVDISKVSQSELNRIMRVDPSKRTAQESAIAEAYGKKLAQKDTTTPKPTPGMLGSGAAASTADILKNRRAQQMKELGLKKGGRTKRKYAEGGSVRSPGHATEQRADAYNDMDEQSGGRTPVRPYFKKGGKFIQKAIKHPGAFKAKAKKAGMSTAAFAAKVTKEGSRASTQTKRQANLAKTLSHLRPHEHGGPVRKGLGGFLKRLVKNPVVNPMASRTVRKVMDPITTSLLARRKSAPVPTPAARPGMRTQPVMGGPRMRRAMGGGVKAARGGDIAQDRRMIGQAIEHHIEAPKPRGHGVKASRMRGGAAC